MESFVIVGTWADVLVKLERKLKKCPECGREIRGKCGHCNGGHK